MIEEKADFLFVGSGFSCAVMARVLAEYGKKCVIIDERKHLAGNCHTERDEHTGILTHIYGPHIFHTDNKEVWNFIKAYGSFKKFNHKVKTTVNKQVYQLPINLHTINQYFGRNFNPKEAQNFITSKAEKNIAEPQNFEEQARSMIGEELYKAFFYGYTKKQWGLEPILLPASILKRLPIRFNYDDSYFNHPIQAMPKDGYTKIIENMLKHENISVYLNCSFEEIGKKFEHTFYSGPLDRYFNFRLGRLGYRSLIFNKEIHDGDFQGTSVMNYGDEETEFTRITEHKYFSPWENINNNKTIIYREYSKLCSSSDIPYYPIRLADEKKMLIDYFDIASRETNISFIGRLGTYQYLDMDKTIALSLSATKKVIKCLKQKQNIPPFFENIY